MKGWKWEGIMWNVLRIRIPWKGSLFWVNATGFVLYLLCTARWRSARTSLSWQPFQVRSPRKRFPLSSRPLRLQQMMSDQNVTKDAILDDSLPNWALIGELPQCNIPFGRTWALFADEVSIPLLESGLARFSTLQAVLPSIVAFDARSLEATQRSQKLLRISQLQIEYLLVILRLRDLTGPLSTSSYLSCRNHNISCCNKFPS